MSVRLQASSRAVRLRSSTLRVGSDERSSCSSPLSLSVSVRSTSSSLLFVVVVVVAAAVVVVAGVGVEVGVGVFPLPELPPCGVVELVGVEAPLSSSVSNTSSVSRSLLSSCSSSPSSSLVASTVSSYMSRSRSPTALPHVGRKRETSDGGPVASERWSCSREICASWKRLGVERVVIRMGLMPMPVLLVEAAPVAEAGEGGAGAMPLGGGSAESGGNESAVGGGSVEADARSSTERCGGEHTAGPEALRSNGGRIPMAAVVDLECEEGGEDDNDGAAEDLAELTELKLELDETVAADDEADGAGDGDACALGGEQAGDTPGETPGEAPSCGRERGRMGTTGELPIPGS